MKAKIKDITYFFPEFSETNADLKRDNPDWDMEKITAKTGITRRFMSEPDQTALDLGHSAAKLMLDKSQHLAEEIDLLILVTQSPDYILPTSACILQERLNLSHDCMAFDINQGCSGFVYGLSVAGSLIESKVASKALIICADSYTKYIARDDRTNRPLFSDAGAATLLVDSKSEDISSFVMGTDGSGHQSLIVRQGGAKELNQNDKKILEMKGSEVFLFTMKRIPTAIKQLLLKEKINIEEIDLFIFHQASKLVIDNLTRLMKLNSKKVFRNYEEKGNTVSATIPIALKDALDQGLIQQKSKVMIVGFGVGLSWGATILNWDSA
jgi:3-oxoacyl-[acyl-carrier-protein] synthase-3